MINIFEPSIDVEKALTQYKLTLESNWFGRGTVANKFEEKLATVFGVNREFVHSLASCTDAIFNIFPCLDLSPDDVVVVPSNSFPAVGSAVLANGYKLIIADIDPKTGNICLKHLTELTALHNVRCVFATDYGGIPVDSKEIRRIIGVNCFLLVDAAGSFGARLSSSAKWLHAESDFTCYSFDAMKLITTGEGGAVVIPDPDLLIRFKEQVYLGLPARQKSGMDVAKSSNSTGWWEYELNCYGQRSVMSDLAAGLGLTQLDNLDYKIQKRYENRKLYEERLSSISNVKLLEQNDSRYEYANYFCTLIVDERDQLASFLFENGVYTTYRYWPLHRISIFEAYAEDIVYSGSDFFSQKALNIPVHDGLSNYDIERISNLITDF